MIRWFLLIIACCGLLGPALAAVEIIDVPTLVSERYDLTWDMTVKSIPSSPLVLSIEELPGKGGYQLRLDKERAEWVQTGVKTPLKPVGGAVSLPAGATVSFTFKRRPGTVALLQNHRLVFCAPAPTPGVGTLVFRQMPAGLEIEEARYSQVGIPRFGDDFMRPEAVRFDASSKAPMQWHEDSAWQVAFFRKDHPGQNPVDPKTSAKLLNPWKLSFYSFVDKTANGFWYLYNGVGPSWVVANPTMVYSTWDRYFVETAVRTEYAGEVGLIAAYQDQKNYLFFRWRQREYIASDHPRAELIAVIDGESRVLASSPRGFDPVQWYKLRINLGWQRVQVLVDGALLLQADNPGMAEGRIGLYANGAENPWRPEVDQMTASMYVTVDKETGAVINDAKDALRRTSVIFFDDVRVGSWEAITDIFSDSPYRMEGDGKWTANRAKGTLQAVTSARLITGPTDWTRYQVSTRVLIPRSGTAGVAFHVNDQGDGYAWLLSADGQKLCPMAQYGIQQTLLAASPVEVKPETWHDLRVEADGAHITLYCDDTPVLDTFDPARTAGRCGVLAPTPGVQFQALSITPSEDRVNRVAVHKFFVTDKWLSAWATPAADWYPVNIPQNLVTPAGLPHAAVGAAAPLPTNEPGLYWHKGGHYRDLRVIIPVSRNTIFGQTLHLSPNYYPDNGYRLRLNMVEGRPTATLLRGATVVAAQPFNLGTVTRLVFQRIGSYLVLYSLDVDVANSLDTVEVKSLQLVFAYRDPQPIKAEKLGFTVTVPLLPADALVVESDALQDTFEQAPDNWLSQSGVWAVMARYSCDPSWNWFGGFGANTPTVWSKYQLSGDQTVEVYMGVKMQYDNMAEEYTRRYRDLNVSICTDGKHLNSGYTFMRAGRYGEQPTTMLLRKGVVVWSSTDAPMLLPDKNQGHRRWFAARLEKSGGEIKVFVDNRLATTYVDPNPLPGGYVGFWTLNNGIMLGRVNLAAEQMTLGTPSSATPLVIHEKLDPLPMPKVTLNYTPLAISTFESDLDGWKERSGLGGRLVRERVEDATRGTNTCLKVINAYPSGDFSASLPVEAFSAQATPLLHFDYCFDPGALVNLYAQVNNTWYELLLTGKEAQEANVRTLGRAPATADGTWRHLEVNLGKLLAEAISKQTGQPAGDFKLSALVCADWNTPPQLRAYGFGNNPGGLALRFDNMVYLPAATGPLNLTWTLGDQTTLWRVAADNAPATRPTEETGRRNLVLQPGPAFLHLQAKTGESWGPVLHLPLPKK